MVTVSTVSEPLPKLLPMPVIAPIVAAADSITNSGTPGMLSAEAMPWSNLLAQIHQTTQSAIGASATQSRRRRSGASASWIATPPAMITPKVSHEIARSRASIAPASARGVARSTRTKAASPKATESEIGRPTGETTTSEEEPKKSSTSVGASASGPPMRRRASTKNSAAQASTATTETIRNGR